MKSPPPLVSLLRMLEFYAAAFVNAAILVTGLKETAGNILVRNPGDSMGSPVEDFDGWLHRLRGLRPHVSELNLPLTARTLDDTINFIDGVKSSGRKAAANCLDVIVIDAYSLKLLREYSSSLQNRMKDELESRVFLAIATEKVPLYRQKEPLFGKEVEDKIQAASEDISEAGKCLALARYTASVFHLMRVMEIGVRLFGGMLGIQAIDTRGKHKNWQNFLDEANKAIGLMPPHQQKTKDLSAISANLYNVKLAWRNEVMHPKQTYTPEEALEVFSASRAFMRNLASLV